MYLTENICIIQRCHRRYENNLKILIDEGYSTVVSSFAGTNMFANCYYKKSIKTLDILWLYIMMSWLIMKL